MQIIRDASDDYGWKNMFLLEKLSTQTIEILLSLGLKIVNIGDKQLCFRPLTLRFSTASFWEDESTYDVQFVIGWDDSGKPVLQNHVAPVEKDMLPF